MLQKASDKFIRIKRDHLVYPCRFVIFITKAHLAILVIADSVIRDSYPVSVIAQVLYQVLGTGKGFSQ